MKLLTTGAFGLVFASYMYTQAFDIAVDTLKHMQTLMDSAAAQLTAVDPYSDQTNPVSGLKQMEL